MASRRDQFDVDDELDNFEGPDESDVDKSDEPEVTECPHCGGLILEEAEQCRHCGTYISTEDAPRRVPWWIVVGLVLAAIVVLAWIF